MGGSVFISGQVPSYLVSSTECKYHFVFKELLSVALTSATEYTLDVKGGSYWS